LGGIKLEIQINVALNEWFKEQAKWKSRADFAREIGINGSTLGDYFGGRRQPSSGNRQKLFKATGLECFRVTEGEGAPQVELPIPEPEKQRVLWSDVGQQLVVIGKAINQLGELLSRSSTSDVVAHVQAVEDTLYTLNDELEFFKEGSPHARRILRHRLSGPDVGYVTTLLKALFDEEKFQNWLAMTTHEVRR
jgi:transcriptional regulator with XRE-family HTH domain